jgi:Ion transport protein
MLLGLINYIYVVLCTELFKDMYVQGLTTDDYFGSLVLTYFTLLELMTLSWSGIARQVMEVYPWSWTIFISFVFISAFIVYNLIIAVICDAVRIVERGREDEKKRLEQLHDDERPMNTVAG